MIYELITKYEKEIEENKKYIQDVKLLSSRKMTGDTKNLHINKTTGRIEALTKVVEDLKESISSEKNVLELMTQKIFQHGNNRKILTAILRRFFLFRSYSPHRHFIKRLYHIYIRLHILSSTL